MVRSTAFAMYCRRTRVGVDQGYDSVNGASVARRGCEGICLVVIVVMREDFG